MIENESQRINVFVCYSHNDKYWIERLRVHLAPVAHDYDIEYWDDSKIKAGTKSGTLRLSVGWPPPRFVFVLTSRSSCRSSGMASYYPCRSTALGDGEGANAVGAHVAEGHR
jgi:hypothetical protein